MKELIEDYKRKVKSCDKLIALTTDEKTLERLKIKRGCYNSFVVELGHAQNKKL